MIYARTKNGELFMIMSLHQFKLLETKKQVVHTSKNIEDLFDDFEITDESGEVDHYKKVDQTTKNLVNDQLHYRQMFGVINGKRVAKYEGNAWWVL